MLSLSGNQLNKASFVDTESPLDLSITNDIASSKLTINKMILILK